MLSSYIKVTHSYCNFSHFSHFSHQKDTKGTEVTEVTAKWSHFLVTF
jgi:hypothetical protein